MNIGFTANDEQFRAEISLWLKQNLGGEFSSVRFRGGPGDEDACIEQRKRWEQQLANGGWIGVGWPEKFGGKGCSIIHQVIYHEEYARAGGPGRVGHIGEGLVGPTLITYGNQQQQQKYLPGILSGQQFWCQGYSEPGAGSDLANVKTKAHFDSAKQQWVINGQKVWTSLAHEADFCFVLARTDPKSTGHKGLGFFLVPMHQPRIIVRPIKQLTGTSEFNEVFFDDAVCDKHDLVGEVDQGWSVAMGLLGFERGVSTLGQQMHFKNELDQIILIAKKNGAVNNPAIRQRIGEAFTGLKIMRYNSLRMLSGSHDGQLKREALIYKLFWSNWHQRLGELAIAVQGPEGEIAEKAPYQLSLIQSRYLFSRADTIYGGSNEIQRNIIAERGLECQKSPNRLSDINQKFLHKKYRQGTEKKGYNIMTIKVPEYVEGRNLIKGKTVLITAAAGAGIGFSAAIRAIEEGCSAIVISDIHEKRLQLAVDKLKKQTGLDAVYGKICNVVEEEQVQALVDYAEEIFNKVTGGGVDILINNAGLGTSKRLIEMADEEWNKVINVTLNGTMRMTRYMMKVMKKRGNGVIVNNASVLGWRAQVEQAHYAAAKAGVMALTRCAALEAVDLGIRINAVAPSLAVHPMLKKSAPAQLLAELEGQEAYGRGAQTWEVANVMMFLASDYSSYLTGEIIACSSQRA